MKDVSNAKTEEEPQVRIGLPEGALRDKLLRALRQAGVQVQAKPLRGNLPPNAGEEDLDLVIVRRSQISKELLEHIYARDDSEESPGWVVLGDDLDDTDRAELLSAGITRVLDVHETEAVLARQVVTLAESEATGGRGGPSGRGVEPRPQLADFLSNNESMQRFLQVVRKVSDADASILITGETGVGKERLARAIHAQSPRSQGPFVAVNCGAFPENLIESELFGHEKGAFTGADSQRIGVFEQAQGGTLFLDEIGELPMHMQVKLLTVLQRLEVRRIGGERDIPVDVRIMAATNRNVKEEVDAGRFREDLYFRLNVVTLDIPALRERTEDIPDLVGGLIKHLCDAETPREVPSVHADAMHALTTYAWPGNVRELINAIERALLMCDGDKILPQHLPKAILQATQPGGQAPLRSGASGAGNALALPSAWYELNIQEVRNKAIEWAEKEYLHHILSENRGHIANTAKRAGIGTRALYDRMKRLDLDKADYKGKRS